jgi:hypothetical protein
MTTSNPSAPSTSLRLRLAPDPTHGPLAGSWWPRSRNLELELADLVDHFPKEAGHISRAVFSRPDWDTSPRRVEVGRGPMKTGSFPHDDTHVVLLKLSTGRQLTVLVVPPDASDEVAHDLMTRAADPANTLSAVQLLAGEREPDPTSA